jgi:hypothetical protein
MDKSEFTEGIEDLIEKESMSPKKAPLDIKIDNLKKDDTDDEVEDLIPEKNINVDISNNVVENIDNKDDLVDESNTKDTQTEDNIDEEVDDKDSETLMTDFLDAIDDNHKENKKE